VTTETTDPAEVEPRKARPTWLWPAVAGVVALVLVGGAAVVAFGGDDSPSYDAQQIGWMHDDCQQWAESDQAPHGTGETCDSMADWMNGRVGQGMPGNGMIGPMMWRDPDSMRATCEQWMDAEPSATPAGEDSSSWCAQMTEWMSQHHADWDGWMMNGPSGG
jgi:hypothetical protein